MPASDVSQPDPCGPAAGPCRATPPCGSHFPPPACHAHSLKILIDATSGVDDRKVRSREGRTLRFAASRTSNPTDCGSFSRTRRHSRLRWTIYLLFGPPARPMARYEPGESARNRPPDFLTKTPKANQLQRSPTRQVRHRRSVSSDATAGQQPSAQGLYPR